MPDQTINVPPELFFTHNGIHVYHTYKDDDISTGRNLFWFTLNAREDGIDNQFDVRDFDLTVGNRPRDKEAHKRAITQALDDGRLQPPEDMEDNLPYAHAVLVEIMNLAPDMDAGELVERALALAQDEARDAVRDGDQRDDPKAHARLQQIEAAEFGVTAL